MADAIGPLDQRLLDFLTSTILDAANPDSDIQLVVIRVDSPGIASGDPLELFTAMGHASVPVAVWVGARPAVAFGGSTSLLMRGDFSGAAQGTRIGYLFPTVAGEPTRVIADETGLLSRGTIGRNIFGDEIGPLLDGTTEITEPIPGIVESVVPTVGQFIAGLDGVEVMVGEQLRTLETVRTEALEDGTEILVPSVEVRFLKPDLFTRFLRLAIWPEAMLFFLIAGFAAAAFELYAAGVGISAGIAAISWFLAGYGMATLPISWWAFAAVVLGLLLYLADFQRNQLWLRSFVGTALLIYGGLNITRTGPQFAPKWWAVLLTVFGVGLFFMFALTTVVRSRFSTRTIGREYLVGRKGVAESAFDPEGLVVLDGARWRARSTRAANLGPGDPVEVLEVRGIILEVGPVEDPAEMLQLNGDAG